MDNELPPIDYHMLARIAKNQPQSLIKPGLSIRKSKRLMTKRAEHTVRAVLDTSVLIKKPELIARRIVGFELIIPHAAEKSLKRRRRGESQPDMPLDVLPTTAFMHLINAAKHHKIITAGYIPAKYRSTSSARYHSQTKSGILEYTSLCAV